MPPRKLQPAPAQKHELEAFAEKYDTLALLYGDPVEVVFAIMARAVTSRNDDLAHLTANTLMGYRYPKVKAQEVVGNQNNAPLTQINISMVQPAELPSRVRTLELNPNTNISDLIGG